MDYNLFWTRRASADIDDIYQFYLSMAGDRVAKRRLSRIKQSLDILQSMPNIGVMDAEFPHTPTYRYLVVLDYRVYYFVEEHTVYIAALWDCRHEGKTFKS